MYQDLLCRQDYAERLVTSFANQIQSEYYVANISVYIEGIVLKHFSYPQQPRLMSEIFNLSLHAVFHYFCPMTANNMLPQ